MNVSIVAVIFSRLYLVNNFNEAQIYNPSRKRS